jgi:O-antigen ligase
LNSVFVYQARVDFFREELTFLSLSLFYLGLLSIGVSSLLTVLILGGAIVCSLSALAISDHIPKIFFVVFGYAVYKCFYYFSVNADIPLDFAFINQEGRFLLLLAIITSLASLRPSAYVVRRFVRLGVIGFLCWAPFMMLHVWSGKTLISSSHHQLGLTSLTGVIYSLMLLKSRRSTSILAYTALGLAFFCLTIANSRTSLLAGIIILLYLYWSKIHSVGRLFFLSLLATASVLVVGFGEFRIGERKYDIASFSAVGEGVSYGLSNYHEITKAYDAKAANIEAADFNIVGRAVVYGKALYLFRESPIFGIGEGRFDDGASCKNPTGMVCVHNQGPSNYNGNSAHNVYLHILAEEGLVGFAALILLLVKLRASIARKAGYLRRQNINAVCGLAAWWVLVVAGIFQHVFASPLYALSLFLPIMLLANVTEGPSVEI